MTRRRTSRNEVIRRYKEGERVADIAKSFGVSKQNIYQLIATYKDMDDPDSYKAKQVKRKVIVQKSDGTIAAKVLPTIKTVVLKLIAKGLSETDIVSKTKYKKATVRAILTEQKIRVPHQDAKKLLIVKLAHEGKSPAKIAVETSSPMTYVRTIFRLNKLPRCDEPFWQWREEYEALVKAAADKDKEKD